MRILSVTANILLACLGSVITLCLSLTGTYEFADDYVALGIIAFILLLLGVVLFFTELISMFKIYDSTLHTVFIAAFVTLMLLFSPDIRLFMVITRIYMPEIVCELGSELSYAGLAVSALVFLKYTYLKDIKINLIPAYAVIIALTAAYTGLAFIGWQTTAHIAAASVSAGIYIAMQCRVFKENRDDATFYFTSAIIFAATGMQTANALYYASITSGSDGWSAGYFGICFVFFISIYLAFCIRNERQARLASEYRLQTEQLKNRILAEQIKPHFIFNALTTIKSMYHKGTAEGDNALGIFSQYLRNSIDIIDEEMIPFEKELENIARYIDFSNINQSDKFNVVYDIDESDFPVPAFSVQPFVENAVKYSNVNRKEDGYIMISSHADGGDIVLKITDNGAGFDPGEIRGGAHGMSNACERFRLLMDAAPQIASEKGRGTEITVRIKREKGAAE